MRQGKHLLHLSQRFLFVCKRTIWADRGHKGGPNLQEQGIWDWSLSSRHPGVLLSTRPKFLLLAFLLVLLNRVVKETIKQRQ
jgi:hypothetical protein